MRIKIKHSPEIPRGAPRRVFPGRLHVTFAGAAALGIAVAVFLPAGRLAPAAHADTASRAQVVANAQPDAGDPSSGGNTTANVDVGAAIALTALTGSFTLDGVPGDSPAQDGAVTMDVFTNNASGYNVTVEAEAATLAGTGTNTDTIPVADLSVEETTTGAFLPLSSAAPVPVYSQDTRSVTAPGDPLSNDYEFNTPIPDVFNDTYSVTLDYVASTNP